MFSSSSSAAASSYSSSTTCSDERRDDNGICQHAKVRVVEGDDKERVFVIHDLATENGTFVNGEEIAKHELNDGDVILVGETELVFKQVRRQSQKSR